MSKIFLYLFFLCITGAVVHSQQKSFTKTPAIGLHASFIDFKGADSLRAFGRYAKPGLALHYQNSFAGKWDYGITVSGAFLDFTDRHNKSLGKGKEYLLLEADGAIRAHLLTQGRLFRPYAQAGAGISLYKNHWGIFMPAGAGCQVSILTDVFILVNAQYRLPVTNTQHRHFYYSIGLAGAIGRKKIAKAQPKSPPLPTVKTVPSPVDSDGDGIGDSLDKCPQAIGVARYQGCPVPDGDGDGINDDDDHCPTQKGVAQNKGCPAIKKEVQEKMDSAARHIFFATGSHTLLKESYAPLDEVAAILKGNPGWQLVIEGHTDNTGTVADNQLLSENRARTVMNYLVTAGVDATRLKATGYGSQQPIDTNKTAAGRAKNRRVVLKLGA
jgi:OmpA-OmpF porin, OOP family